MNKFVSLLAATLITGSVFAQTPAPAATTVKAVQPGLYEASGARVIEVAGAGIQKITAAANKGRRAIHVQTKDGGLYFGWPKGTKPVSFTIETGKPGGIATINAPGFTQANREDYRAAIDTIVAYSIARIKDANVKYHK